MPDSFRADRTNIMKCCRVSFSVYGVRSGCAGAERWITKTNPVRSLDACFVGRAGPPVNTLLRAVQAPSERGAACWALLQTLGFCAGRLGAAPAVPPYKFS